MKRSKNTKPKAKPNGWEQDIKEDLYAIGAKPIHFEMNNAGVRIINKIHQAILSAEEAKVRECIEIANQEGLMFFKIGTTKEEIDRCGRIRKQMRKEIVDKLQALSLPDQEQLSNNKTDE